MTAETRSEPSGAHTAPADASRTEPSGGPATGSLSGSASAGHPRVRCRLSLHRLRTANRATESHQDGRVMARDHRASLARNRAPGAPPGATRRVSDGVGPDVRTRSISRPGHPSERWARDSGISDGSVSTRPAPDAMTRGSAAPSSFHQERTSGGFRRTHPADTPPSRMSARVRRTLRTDSGTHSGGFRHVACTV